MHQCQRHRGFKDVNISTSTKQKYLIAQHQVILANLNFKTSQKQMKFRQDWNKSRSCLIKRIHQFWVTLTISA